jgi:pilus assembly protein Flp/PilA
MIMSDTMLNIAAWVETLSASARETLQGNEEGQGMVEYGLILALVSIAAIAALVILGPQIAARFTGVSNALTNNP